MKPTPRPTLGRPTQDSGLPAWHGHTLRLIRLSKGISARELGRKLNVSKSTVLRWERSEPRGPKPASGANAPTPDQVRQLATTLGVSQITFSRASQVTQRERR